MIDDQKRVFSESATPEQVICEYWRQYVQNHNPQEAISKFQMLFVEGRCDNRFIQKAVETITIAEDAQTGYFYIFSRSFYITISYWLKQKQDRKHIWQLLQLFEEQKQTKRHYLRHKKKIGVLFQQFLESQYPTNFVRVAIACNCPLKTKVEKDIEFKSILCRYPYLYQQLLLVQDDCPEIVDLVGQLKNSRNKRFERDLAQHFIYRSRLVEIAKAKQLSFGAGKILRKVANPTLLSDRDFQIIVKQYIKKLDDRVTLADLANRFVLTTKEKMTYRQFKLNLARYLAYGIVPRKSDYSLLTELSDTLTNLYYQSDSLVLNDSLTLLTCRKLYQQLIIKSATSKDHQILMRLVTNLGTAQTAMLLIKIALICPPAKVDLENRLANLFINYELRIVEKNLWLVKLLEHCLVTLSIYFGEMDVSVNSVI